MSVLAVEGLRVRLPTPAGDVTVVDGVDYEVQPAEVFGIAGESGSGKTVSMLALLGLLPDGSTVEGSARFGADDLITISRHRLQSIKGASCRRRSPNLLTSQRRRSRIGWPRGLPTLKRSWNRAMPAK